LSAWYQPTKNELQPITSIDSNVFVMRAFIGSNFLLTIIVLTILVTTLICGVCYGVFMKGVH